MKDWEKHITYPKIVLKRIQLIAKLWPSIQHFQKQNLEFKQQILPIPSTKSWFQTLIGCGNEYRRWKKIRDSRIMLSKRFT